MDRETVVMMKGSLEDPLIEETKKLCFVIGPIGDIGTETRRHADWLLQLIIDPVFEQNFTAFEVERSDRISTPGAITTQIINRLHTAQLVIADLSFANANAFYEMGIRHMKRLPTIHMYHEGHTIPFDVKPYRAVPFKITDDPQDLFAARAALKAAVEEAIRPEHVVENPVTQALGVAKFVAGLEPALGMHGRHTGVLTFWWLLEMRLLPNADVSKLLKDIARPKIKYNLTVVPPVPESGRITVFYKGDEDAMIDVHNDLLNMAGIAMVKTFKSTATNWGNAYEDLVGQRG